MYLESLLKYYQNELEFLVEGGKSFANKYPDLAKTLDFSSFSSNDPDIQRLIESTAFLNAKLQKKLDEQAPEISSEILNAIYPQFNSPIPSFTIMNFSNTNKTTFSKKIKKNTLLTSLKELNEQNYIFQTTMDVNIAPCEIEDIQIIKTNTTNLPYLVYNKCDNAILIDLKKYGKTDELTFYIHMPDQIAYSVYEALMNFYPEKNTPIFENNEQIGEIEAIGFNENENLLPINTRENAAYRILMEYSIFPKKFLFFKAKFQKEPVNQIIIPFNTKKEIYIKKNDLLLNCCPAVNLFEKKSEPINVNHKNTSYIINADNNAKKNIEIHSILNISNTNFKSEIKYSPYFSCNHLIDNKKQHIFWLAKRKENKNLQGYDINLSLIESDFNFEKNVLYAKLLCFQKNCNLNIATNESWNINNNPGNIKCINLDRPTANIDPVSDSKTQWRLISHLAINHFGFENNDYALEYIKELLSIYDFNNSTNKNVIFDLKEIKYENNMVSEMGCVVPKTQITLKADNEQSAQIFLLGHVLGNFFSKMISFNTKIDVLLKKQSTNEVWKKWKII